MVGAYVSTPVCHEKVKGKTKQKPHHLWNAGSVSGLMSLLWPWISPGRRTSDVCMSSVWVWETPPFHSPWCWDVQAGRAQMRTCVLCQWVLLVLGIFSPFSLLLGTHATCMLSSLICSWLSLFTRCLNLLCHSVFWEGDSSISYRIFPWFAPSAYCPHELPSPPLTPLFLLWAPAMPFVSFRL